MHLTPFKTLVTVSLTDTPSLEGLVSWYKKKVAEADARGVEYKNKKDRDELADRKKKAIAKLNELYTEYKENFSKEAAKANTFKGLLEKGIDALQNDLKGKKFNSEVFHNLKADNSKDQEFIKYKILSLGAFKGSVLVQWINKIISDHMSNNGDVRTTAMEIDGNGAYELSGEEDRFSPVAREHEDEETRKACFLDVGQTLSSGGYPPNYVELFIQQKSNMLKTLSDLMILQTKINEIYSHTKSKIENFTFEEHQEYKALKKENKYMSDTHVVEHFPDWGFRDICEHIKYAPSDYMYYVHAASLSASHIFRECYKKA